MRQYYAVYSNPPVSPYLNLGVDANGISNYQTLVRPLIEEHEAIAQQSAAIGQLNQHLHPSSTRPDRREVDGAGTRYRPRVRFMDYSHYYGSDR